MSNTYKVLSSEKAFKEMFKALKKAKKYIHVETFTLRNDLIGKELINILAKKSEEIPVRFIVDDRGLKTLSKKQEETIAHSNIEFYNFNPKWSYLKRMQFSRLLSNMIHMTHRKLTLVDGEVAFIGGINYNSKEVHWRDITVKIQGEILEDIEKVAREMKGIVQRKRRQKRKFFKSINKTFKGKDIILRQAPYSQKHNMITREIMKIIRKAKKTIYIATPYYVPPPPFLIALQRARKKGVRIQIIIPKKADRKDASLLNVYNAFLSYKAKINIRLYKGMIHSKYIIVDGKITSVGSANLDFQTWLSNYELNIISKNKDFVKQIKQIWAEDLKKTEEFDPKKHYHTRTFFQKIITRILRPFKKYF